MYKMSNEIQFYAWGSKSFVQDLTQQSDKVGIPAAELWMGAHPKAPSKIMLADSEQTLNRFISSAPKKVLGNSHSKYGRKLPFLLKVLAADKALSIQAHPDLDQAQYGFHREQKTRISIKSDKRNYHDANHKPELICALTDFYAMCGFRTYDQILVNFRKYELDRYFSRFEQFANLPDERSLRYLFNEILSCDADKKTRILDHIQLELDQDDLFIEHLNEADSNVRYWIQVLKDQFPDDIGILSPLFLNIIKLHPFEAIYLPARVLHAYLLGAGMEIMASSDNVLRGGLTSKNIDIPELISVLDFKPFNPVILNPKQKKKRPSNL